MSHPAICVRCGAQSHPSKEHLCADVQRRYDRRVKQRDAVVALLLARFPLIGRDLLTIAAEEIVATLVRIGVEQDG